jgi:hypothetical protein
LRPGGGRTKPGGGLVGAVVVVVGASVGAEGAGTGAGTTVAGFRPGGADKVSTLHGTGDAKESDSATLDVNWGDETLEAVS